MSEGNRLAKKDFEEYKAGKLTKEDLMNACQFAKWAAAFGDEYYQECGYDYLETMEELGFIRDLHIVD